MKIVIWILFIASLTAICVGFWTNLDYSQKLIGFGTAGLFFLVFPLFSYYRWKGKKLEDYMLTKENLDKMRENQKSNKY
ncbi:hypothetical protein RM697_04660 [Ichthyenterobacterium sp. W332]|uniref:Uncharacterized protein n=1 Tax=Microcosmobacter mediterraneus TaxID=3075607 RepID=A0ABU2YJR5_9FLAO|nr:hypothetical protein [Ichthyenterobacterium sp. W332]MDT0557924.1 hypothetical protein [Ichthyenterobacterium sp. W332]